MLSYLYAHSATSPSLKARAIALSCHQANDPDPNDPNPDDPSASWIQFVPWLLSRHEARIAQTVASLMSSHLVQDTYSVNHMKVTPMTGS